MNQECHTFMAFLEEQSSTNSKADLTEKAADKFHLIKDGKIFHNDSFAVRFSFSKNGSFSNTVMALSKLEKYDHIPVFIVLVVTGRDNRVYLSNSTLIKKVSHSSKRLSLTNIKGSFNGSDISKCLGGLSNSPENFDELYAIHRGLSWQDNLERIVEATSSIGSTRGRFQPNEKELSNIRKAPLRACEFVRSTDFKTLLEDLNYRCSSVAQEIVIASRIENINIRGRLIEFLVTADEETRPKTAAEIERIEKELPRYETRNTLGDYHRVFENSDTYTDIKTKIICLDSNPKAFDIDKFLECMSGEKSVFLFFFIGIDPSGITGTALVSVFHKSLIETSIAQEHWSGRSTRGHVQYRGETIRKILETGADFTNEIDAGLSEAFLDAILKR